MPMNDNDPLDDAVTRGVQRGVDGARAMHKAFGMPLVIWRDGCVQHVDPITLQPIAWPQSVRDGERPPLPPTS